ncbi:OadG family protein [Gammaproteobacteria bacterium]|nr:OadG family protein [Gammaproteobacteria bacterium]|tara:strand:- start:4322 stop:4564 length:243 start_codon:yes stop_codon:yes gene_type:complete
MEVTLISQGSDLMLFGMGTVFSFLTLLVGITHLMSATVNYYSPGTEISAVAESQSIPLNPKIEPNVVKVIQSAIDQHRGR